MRSSGGVDAIFEKPLDWLVFGKKIRAMIDERRATSAPTIIEHANEDPVPAAGPMLPDPAWDLDRRNFDASKGGAYRLAAELRTTTVKAFAAETTGPCFCGLIDAHQVDLILIENAHYGFLSAAKGTRANPELRSPLHKS